MQRPFILFLHFFYTMATALASAGFSSSGTIKRKKIGATGELLGGVVGTSKDVAVSSGVAATASSRLPADVPKMPTGTVVYPSGAGMTATTDTEATNTTPWGTIAIIGAIIAAAVGVWFLLKK